MTRPSHGWPRSPRKRCSRNARCSSSRTPPATITTSRNSQMARRRSPMQALERIVGHVVQRRREAPDGEHQRDHHGDHEAARQHADARFRAAAGRPPKNTASGRSPRRRSSNTISASSSTVSISDSTKTKLARQPPSACIGRYRRPGARTDQDLRRIARAQQDLHPGRPGWPRAVGQPAREPAMSGGVAISVTVEVRLSASRGR